MTGWLSGMGGEDEDDDEDEAIFSNGEDGIIFDLERA